MPGRKSLLSLPFSPAREQRVHVRGHIHGINEPGTNDSWAKGWDLPGTLPLGQHKEREQVGRRALTGQEFPGASPALPLTLLLSNSWDNLHIPSEKAFL